MKFIIDEEPVAQGRPRISTKGRPRAFDPKKSKEWKNYVSNCVWVQMKQNRWDIIDKACVLSIKVYKSVPKSYSKKKTALCHSGEIRPITKPDLDNYIKGVKDGMNGIVWTDDAIVVDYFDTGKYYVEENGRPRVEAIVEPLDKIRLRQLQRQKIFYAILRLEDEAFDKLVDFINKEV